MVPSYSGRANGDCSIVRPDQEQKHVVAASFLGWSLDAFDFFLLVLVLKDIAAEFHTDISNVWGEAKQSRN
jgi:hypothetical protein